MFLQKMETNEGPCDLFHNKPLNVIYVGPSTHIGPFICQLTGPDLNHEIC